jgi:hypothetical protein
MAVAVEKGEQALTDYLQATFDSPALSRLLGWAEAVSNVQKQVDEARKRLSIIQEPALQEHAKIMGKMRREIESSMVSAVSAFNGLTMEERGAVVARRSTQFGQMSARERWVLAGHGNGFRPASGLPLYSSGGYGVEGQAARKKWDEHLNKLREKLAVRPVADAKENPFEVSRLEALLAELKHRKMEEAKAKAESWLEGQVGPKPRQGLYLTRTTKEFDDLSPERKEELRELARRDREAALAAKIAKWREESAGFRDDPRYKELLDSWKDDLEIRDLTKRLQAMSGIPDSPKNTVPPDNPFTPQHSAAAPESTHSGNPFVPASEPSAPSATPSGNPFAP